MNRKSMLLALAAISAAALALPSAASADFAHVNATDTFTVETATVGFLRTTSGSIVECKGMSGSGNLSTTTTGALNLTFTECRNNGLFCKTGEDALGTITMNNLEFHLIKFSHAGQATPGVLITSPNGPIKTEPPSSTHVERVFSTFSCGGVPFEVIGNGLIGRIEIPCGSNSAAPGILFAQTITNGHSTFISWTNTNYDLTTKVANMAHSTSALEATGTITFAGGSKTITCT